MINSSLKLAWGLWFTGISIALWTASYEAKAEESRSDLIDLAEDQSTTLGRYFLDRETNAIHFESHFDSESYTVFRRVARRSGVFRRWIDRIDSFAVDEEKELLAAVTSDGSVYVVDLLDRSTIGMTQNKKRFKKPDYRQIAFSQTGSAIATISAGTVRVPSNIILDALLGVTHSQSQLIWQYWKLDDPESYQRGGFGGVEIHLERFEFSTSDELFIDYTVTDQTGSYYSLKWKVNSEDAVILSENSIRW